MSCRQLGSQLLVCPSTSPQSRASMHGHSSHSQQLTSYHSLGENRVYLRCKASARGRFRLSQSSIPCSATPSASSSRKSYSFNFSSALGSLRAYNAAWGGDTIHVEFGRSRVGRPLQDIGGSHG